MNVARQSRTSAVIRHGEWAMETTIHPSGWDWSQVDRSKEARSSPGNLICVVWFMFEERIRFGQELEFSIGKRLTPSIPFFVPYLFGV